MSFYTYSELAEFRYQKTKKKMAEIAKSRKGLATEKQRKYIKDLILKRFSEEDQDRFLKALGKKQLDKLSFADACVMIEILTEKTVLEVQALIDKQKLRHISLVDKYGRELVRKSDCDERFLI